MESSLPKPRSLAEIEEEWNQLTMDEQIERIIKSADAYDEWVDELTDRFIDDMPSYSSQEAYRIDNLMHSHRQIAEMMADVCRHWCNAHGEV